MANDEGYLDSQHALVTGASRGIGAAIARALAARGARLTLLARSAEGAQGEAGAIHREFGVDVRAIACDVTDASRVSDAFAQGVAALGPVHILVNNAGAGQASPFGELTRDVWDATIAVNLTATYTCTSLSLPAMLDAKRGRVVNIASTAGLRGYKTSVAYCAAKHGVVGFTRALALETAKHGVTVNAVCPGYTDTEMSQNAISNLMRALGKSRDEATAMLLTTIPRGTFTTPGEVAAAVSWLCSPAAAAVTGIALPVAGGEI
jgi:NAD(P)-dependent dehydrogenase (short-subunit alcohol dehydrogenase family)